jgi:hypothetical protein
MTALLPDKNPDLSAQAFSVRASGPQGLRRPRFSFFRFTCQTSRNLAAPSSKSILPRQVPKPLKPATSDAATRTWPRLHGRMLGHRVNSEGLRRHATARGDGAPKRTYIVFGRHNCQPSEPRNKPYGSRKIGNFCRLSRIGGEPRRGLPIALVETGLAAGTRVFGHCCAALRPYSSAVLCTIVSGRRNTG